jgi:hypothetical protein
MKRFIPFILTVAIITGVFSPVMASFTEKGPAMQFQTARAQTKDQDSDTAIKDNIHCGVFGKSSMGGCIEWIVYFIPYTVGGLLLKLSANILDTTAAYTLSSKVYTTSTFITLGWRITRDFANVFFILILLFIALSLVLGLEVGHANPKKMLISVIIVAVLINFSLFITEVVIDTSNALALVFYNQITAVDKKTGKPIDTSSELNSGSNITKDLGVKQKPVATALAQAFQPQSLQTKEFFEHLKADPSKDIPVGTMITILLVMGTLFCVAAYSFFVASFAFIGRLIQLWLLIIFAPFAFVTYIVPSLHNIELFGWSDWLKKLGSTAFAAPIYFFFILLISLLAKAAVVSDAAFTSSDSWSVLIAVFISTMLVAIMLIQGTKYVKKASGAFGEKFAGVAGSIAGFVGGAALGAGRMGAGAVLGTAAGTTARIGQNTLGVLGNRLANNETLRKGAANWMPVRKVRDLAIGASEATFDIRNTKQAAKFTKKTKINLDKYSAIKNSDTAGGFKEKDTRRALKMQKTAEKLGYNKKKQDKIEASIKTEIGKNGKNLETREHDVAAATQNHQSAEAKVATATTAVTTANAEVVKAQREVADAKTPNEKTMATTNLAKAQTVKASADELLAQATAETTQAKAKLDGAKQDFTDLKKLEEESKNNKNAIKRAYFHSQGGWTGYKVNPDGTIDKTKDPESRVRTNLQMLRRLSGTIVSGAAAGALVGSVVPVAGTAIGTVVGGLSGIIRELANAGGSTGEANAINLALTKSEADLKKNLKGKATYTEKIKHDADLTHLTHMLHEAGGHGHDDKAHKEEAHAPAGGGHDAGHH